MAADIDAHRLSRSAASGGMRQRCRATGALAIGGTVAATVLLALPAAQAAAGESTATVIVTGGDAGSAAAAVTAAGGHVVDLLPLIAGVSATLPVGRALAASYRVTANRPFTVASTTAAAASTAAAAAAGAGEPAVTVRSTVGLPPAGTEGSGVTVAVVDTGVADVPELAGRIVGHLDMSRSSDRDGFGHGTFMAGLIAASGVASGGAYRGVAPGANILDVRVANSDGSTGLVQVLRGLQAVASRGHRYGVRVVNLSLSSDSPAQVADDPLVLALDGLWHAGITVVVPAGNGGPAPGSVASPGIDPTLLTAGAVDPVDTIERGDDVVPSWSGRGDSADELAKPDLVAPGTHVVSLRDPGSVIDTENPGSRVGDSYFRGSGTSMSTAVTAGAVADVLAVRPDLSPDAVKELLTGTTYDAPGLANPDAAGTGGLDAAAALAVAPTAADDPAHGQGWLKHRLDAGGGSVPGDPARWGRLTAALGADDRDAAARARADLDPDSRAWASRAWASRAWASRAWASRAWASRAWA
jgi:serine protease AprX